MGSMVTVPAKVADQGWVAGPGATDRFWTAAFTCNAGDMVHIGLRGSAQQGPPRIHNGVGWYDPIGQRISSSTDGRVTSVQAQAVAGGKNFLCPGLPTHALVGRFGAGAPFLVGTGTSTQATGDDLFLAVNDQPGQFFNDEGSYTVEVDKAYDGFPYRGEFTFEQGKNYLFSSGYYVVHQADGNLVVYLGGRRPTPDNAVWALNMVFANWQSVRKVQYLRDQLVALDASGTTLWESNAADGRVGYQLSLDDGALRVVRPSRGQIAEKVLWTSRPA